MSSKNLRILCLHGFLQNATIFYKKSGFLRTALKNIAELDYISGPFIIEDEPTNKDLIDQPLKESIDQAKGHQPLKAWFRRKENKYIGFEATLALLKEHILKEGPFDGVMGFSQG